MSAKGPEKVPPLAFLFLLTLALIWGSSFILMKRGVEVYSPLQVGLLRSFSASVVLAPVGWFHLRELPRKDWGLLLLAGLVGSLLPAVFFGFASDKVQSSVLGMMGSLTPIFTLLVGLAAFQQKVGWGKIAGVLVGLGGTTILILAKQESGQAWHWSWAALLPVAATFCYGLNLNLIKFRLQHIKPFRITSVSLLFVGPLAGVWLFSTDFLHRTAHAEGAAWALTCLLILGVVGTAFALILFNNMVKLASPIFSSSVTYLIPVVALVWGLVDGESLQATHYGGLATILTGLTLIRISR